jgi:hypothetical protein
MLVKNIVNIVTLLICLQNNYSCNKLDLLMKPQTWSNCDKIEHLVAWERLKNDKISFLNVIVNRSHNLFLGGGRWGGLN